MKEQLPSNERDINRHLIALKYDICRKSEDCQPCQGLREKSIEIIERLQREVDGYRKMALLREQEANALRSTVEPKTEPLGAETRAATSRGAHSTEDAGRPQPSEPPKDDHWWCDTCKRELQPDHVTNDETHDIRAGGCGQHVMEERPRPVSPPKANCPECYGVGHLATFIDGARVQDTPCPRGCSSVTRETESSRERVAPCVRELSERGTTQPPSVQTISCMSCGCTYRYVNGVNAFVHMAGCPIDQALQRHAETKSEGRSDG